MRFLVASLITLVLMSSTAKAEKIRAVYRGDLATNLQKFVVASSAPLLKYYEDLHAHPELSLNEKETARKVAHELAKHGYKVTQNVGGYGVVGVFKNGPGPTILVRGDMDALPITEDTGLVYASKVVVPGSDGRPAGVMHACGHDIHQTCLVATASVMAAFKEYWRGTLVIVAQPAEEIGKGAVAMINDGLFERFPVPDYYLALHVSSDLPVGVVGYTSGWALANVDSVDITIFGVGGHGSRPNQTVDPIVTAAQVINSLQTIVSRRLAPTEPGVVTVGSIHAGSKHNIIPGEAKLQLTVRSYSDETRKLLLDGIREITINTCRAMGCPRDPIVDTRDDEFTPATYNDPRLTKALVGILQEVLGGDNVIEEKAKMGGEDFGQFSRKHRAPSFIYWLGSVGRKQYNQSLTEGGSPLPPLHSSTYSPDPMFSIRSGAVTMSALVLSLMDQP